MSLLDESYTLQDGSSLSQRNSGGLRVESNSLNTAHTIEAYSHVDNNWHELKDCKFDNLEDAKAVVKEHHNRIKELIFDDTRPKASKAEIEQERLRASQREKELSSRNTQSSIFASYE